MQLSLHAMVSRIPSLNWLRVFEAAARTESFARAANQLNMSAAAVSQQIKALEGHLGARLFERRAQAVVLTEAGRAYLPTVERALGALEGATEGLFGQRAQDQLFVQATLIYAHGLLAPRLPKFQSAHPHVALSLNTPNHGLETSPGFHDLRIVFGQFRLHGAQADPLEREILTPMARPETAAQIRDLTDLMAHPLIEVATHRAGWAHVFDTAGVRPGPLRWLYADNSLVAASLAAAGAGICLARAPATDLIMQGAGLAACLPNLAVPGAERYHLIYEDKHSLRPAARNFRGWLLEEVFQHTAP